MTADFAVAGDDSDMIGTVVGTRFQIVGRIGEGWLFTVYRARDQLTGQLVAVKVLRQPFATQRHFVEALLQTFERHLYLAHPSLVRYLTAGETEEGLPFFVCELVAGHSLSQLLERRLPLPIQQALDLLSQVADAIGYLHHNGIVHGDLRPHNILVTPRGEVKVGDYGIWSVFLSSRIVEAEWLELAAPYLAPERFQGSEATPEGDVYFLGVILFQTLTGRLPFEASRVADFAHLHFTSPVPLASSLNPSAPFSLDAIILKAMAKEPSQRFKTANDFRNAVQEVLATLAVETERESSYQVTTSLTSPAEEGKEILSLWQRLFQSAFGLILGLVIGLVSVSLVIYALLVGTKPKEVIVPDVTGMKLSQARQILSERNLNLIVSGWEFSSEVPAEHIIRMENPLPNQRVLEGREIFVVASQGEAKVTVPDLSGKSVQEALLILKKANLPLGQKVDTYSENIPQGYVIGQQPPPRIDVPEGTPINIIVSKGPPPPEPEIDWSKLPPEARALKVAIVIGGIELRQIVQIIVSDEEGEREVYRGVHVPGDKVVKTVIVYGPAKIRVLVNGREVSPPQEL
ncbi:MAG: protein kinase [Armatimonadetes bacterium]|nr:protein kinase [Armatimonadota bacterium]